MSKKYNKAIFILIVIVLALQVVVNGFIPCKYLMWIAVKDLPARCLVNE